jgi:prepilin-type processing-associated H-X9-DG protein
VVAIISLLVSILLPSLQRAKELAKTAFCLTRLRNIGGAYGLYVADYDRGPLGFTYGDKIYGGSGYNRPSGTVPRPNPYGSWQGWYAPRKNARDGGEFHFLGLYLERNPVGIIGKAGETPENSPVSCPNAPSSGAAGGYAVNGHLGYDVYLGDWVEAMSSSPMLMCSKFFYVPWNGYRMNYMAYPGILYALWGPDMTDAFEGSADEPHQGSSNFLFLDSHAENQRFLGPGSAPEYKRMWTWHGS